MSWLVSEVGERGEVPQVLVRVWRGRVPQGGGAEEERERGQQVGGKEMERESCGFSLQSAPYSVALEADSHC